MFVFSLFVPSHSFQRLEWEAAVAKCPPLKTLTVNDLPQPGKKVPLRLYGWPITEDYMLDYARRHRLVFDVFPCHRKRLGGAKQYSYGDLTDEDLADADLFLSLRRRVNLDVLIFFLREAGATNLKFKRPLSLKWNSMLVVWSTEDYERTYSLYQMYRSWEKAKKFIDDALNECLPEGCGRRTSLEWWWSCENRLDRLVR